MEREEEDQEMRSQSFDDSDMEQSQDAQTYPEGYPQERPFYDEEALSQNERQANSKSTLLHNAEPNAGFIPLEADSTSEKQRQEMAKARYEAELQKRKRTDAEVKAEQYWKDEINRLINDYPGIVHFHNEKTGALDWHISYTLRTSDFKVVKDKDYIITTYVKTKIIQESK